MFAKPHPEVLVVGAGPVGLFTAISLARRGVRVQIADRDWRTGAHSYALALHGRSLALLGGLGLAEQVLEGAYRVQKVGFYEGDQRRAELKLADQDNATELVVLRQDVLEHVLEQALAESGIKVLWNHEVARLTPSEHTVTATVNKMVRESVGYAVAHHEWVAAKTYYWNVPFVVGADGHRSRVRRSLDIDFPEVGPAQHFAVFEFRTDADLDHEMRVVLDEKTTNVLWPLPGGACRWSFQLLDQEAPATSRAKDRVAVQLGGAQFPVLSEEHLQALIAERAPWFRGSIGEVSWRIVVRFERRLAECFGRDQMWLAGDAGHITGPVGMQSMNVGFLEGEQLADILAGILREGHSTTRLSEYNRTRLAEWKQLLAVEGGLAASEATDPWVAKRAERLLGCLPASGNELTALAAQLGLVGADARMKSY